jgi:hypothetical protein
MRELEFLPAWYPVLRRRRALAATQAYATAVLMVGLLLWGVMAHQHVLHTQAHAAATTEELRLVRGDLKMLDEQLQLKQQLQQQEDILRKIGFPVDATRLLGELDEIMGRPVFLLNLNVETEETVRTGTSPGNAANAPENADRKLKVKVVGVAPSDVDVANFLAGLSSRTYFDQVAMTYARDRFSAGRVMREFEVSFLINLNGTKSE